MTGVGVRMSQSELFPAVMSTLHKFCVHGGCCFPRIFAQFASKSFTQSTESVSPQYRCFAETFNKEVSNVLCEKPIILVELLFELRIVVIHAR